MCVPGARKAYGGFDKHKAAIRIAYGWSDDDDSFAMGNDSSEPGLFPELYEHPVFDEEVGRLVYHDIDVIKVVDILNAKSVIIES